MRQLKVSKIKNFCSLALLLLLVKSRQKSTVFFRPKPSNIVGLNEGLKTLLNAIKSNPGMKTKALSVSLKGRSIKTLEHQIKFLIEKKLIERRGSKKTGGYWPV
ncbi:MAG: hypothetical protein A2452_09765 [Candidatus Firestonebacteria bacterium RIFOXYC2_FULL_39_67]|nr:MAG: hypothetical protein A2536_04005 [Candidatus Firestonebacteria bacterium RIFOXYD2_FULL_39_29]OGF51850.1 MAG: hypothetical protein A2497_00720 [Candidatus Firestonebacteria bacterium RifOxyC12_full_39_7]OGF54649.1 MAG: hypothetical protein A2452_09765 [Candidatus Firestonebacteria bacterium RIFOXYC2_FULL_39_67]